MKTSTTTISLFAGTLVGLAGNTALRGAAPLAPIAVPGKEYTDLGNVLDAGRILLWDGSGSVANGPKYWPQVDATAHRADALLAPVRANRASLLFSVEGDSPGASIWYENPDGAGGAWASKAQVNAHGVNDLNSLEVWGPEGTSNIEVVSLAGDPAGTSMMTTTGGHLLYQLDVAYAIGLYPGAGTVNGVALDDRTIIDLIYQIDVDALMFSWEGEFVLTELFEDPPLWPVDLTGEVSYEGLAPGSNPRPPIAGLGGESLFSIAPIFLPGGDVLFDGGEIWVYSYFGQDVPFLDHGGHLWNTEFGVRGTFGVDSENIDALEAVPLTPVPEAGTLAASGVLLGLAGRHLWQRRRKQA